MEAFESVEASVEALTCKISWKWKLSWKWRPRCLPLLTSMEASGIFFPWDLPYLPWKLSRILPWKLPEFFSMESCKSSMEASVKASMEAFTNFHAKNKQCRRPGLCVFPWGILPVQGDSGACPVTTDLGMRVMWEQQTTLLGKKIAHTSQSTQQIYRQRLVGAKATRGKTHRHTTKILSNFSLGYLPLSLGDGLRVIDVEADDDACAIFEWQSTKTTISSNNIITNDTIEHEKVLVTMKIIISVLIILLVRA